MVYQIYPRSFKDTNGDGIGDLNGIISEIETLKALGIGILWISPVYASPNVDFGYDISDYYAIHPDYGTMTEMVDSETNAYYLHLFTKHQPDLNYHNPSVIQEIQNIMEFWLEKGVDGFRCDVINILYKQSLDNSKKRLVLPGSEYYLSKSGVHALLKYFRKTVWDKYKCFTVGETVFVTPEDAKKFIDPKRQELDLVFSFEHVETDQFIVKWFKRKFNLRRFAKVIFKWQTALYWNANYLENHDQPRSVSRFADDHKYWHYASKMLAMLLMTLKGTPFIYQGQEIGMTNFAFINGQMLQMQVFLLRRLGYKSIPIT
ncbi:glycosidase [Fusibacter tunisiensis]|uniref:Glycosidase n=1 Tax=Fusibacter tunisiensis TaxID=1008308 RepID=A0ABS2MU91_9FIRM|nr:glycosidase [Fusibacter tunisiensis]